MVSPRRFSVLRFRFVQACRARTLSARTSFARTLRTQSPVRSFLYRKQLAAVILSASAWLVSAVVLCTFFLGGASAQELTEHYGRKPPATGPRALGIVQLSSTGKARLYPIAIMMDGKFYDAGSYKAAPVPMALDFGIVYEALKAGVSQGLFTITQPGQLNHNWIAQGSWLPAGVKPPETAKKYAAPVIEEESKDERPVLHRHTEGAADKDESKPAANPSPTTPSSAPPSPSSTPAAPSSPPSSSPQSSGAPQPSATPPTSTGDKLPAASTPNPTTANNKDTSKDAAQTTAKAAAKSSPDEPFNDPNRPHLRRGKPDPSAHHELFVDFDAPENTGTPASAIAPPNGSDVSVQTFTAISDAHGPDPRPYTYDLKPAEEAIYRTKMLELASTLVKVSAAASATEHPSTLPAKPAPNSRKSASAKSSKPAKLEFESVNLRIFDLSSSNEPVLVLSARTPLPPAAAAGAQLPQEITLIARTNLEGELQKVFFAQTDSRHLDVSPRMELIDVVDADGDGRGELLFRQTSDAGSAYAIYRVAADQLWSLYQGTP
jgi:hypothetical protein